jgi:hypothetical protein
MLPQNQKSSSILCPNGTPQDPETCWTQKGTGVPPPARSREPIPESTPSLPCTAPATTSNTSAVQRAEIVNLLPGYTYLHTALRCAEFFQDDENTKHNTNFDSDMLTNEG